MIKAEIPVNEKTRLSHLEELDLLPVLQEDSYDNITKLASFICNTPVSLITLIGEDQQWFKSKVGTDKLGAAREISHCSHAILKPGELMVVKDTRKDARFKNNPYTLGNPPLLFYAGMPLKTQDGSVLGTLCVLDTSPRNLNTEQEEAIRSLARQVENLFELRRQNIYLRRIEEELKRRNEQLKEFAGTVSHDMKMPLANIIITSDLLRMKYADKLDDQGKVYLDYLKKSSFQLSNYIQSILEHYESDTLSEKLTEDFDIHDLLEQIIDLLNINFDCEIHLPDENKILHCNRAALEQIFMNLIGNSLKYNNREKIEITVTCEEDDEFYYFSIIDNGIGIPKDKQEEIFELFTVLAEKDRAGNRGNGIGLSTVKKLVTSMKGEIMVKSELNEGTTINFSVRKGALC